MALTPTNFVDDYNIFTNFGNISAILFHLALSTSESYLIEEL